MGILSSTSPLINRQNKPSGPLKNIPFSGNNDTHKINNLTSNESEKFSKAVNEYHQKKNNMLQQRPSQFLTESKESSPTMTVNRNYVNDVLNGSKIRTSVNVSPPPLFAKDK